MKNFGPQNELIERLGNAVKNLHDLLEHYAPMWYSNELREEAETALQMLDSELRESDQAALHIREKE